MKSYLLSKLAKALTPYLEKNNTSDVSRPAFLSHEGCIENFAQDPERITVGNNSYVRGRLLTYGHGGSIKIGDWSYIGLRSEIWSMDSITIGNRVLISHDVNIHDGTAHSTNAAERHLHFKTILEKGHPTETPPGVNSSPIIIEDDVWISFGVTILKGVRIGKGSIICAGAIVTKDVPSHTLYKCNISPQLTAI